MMYAYYLYRDKSFCKLDTGFASVQAAFDTAVDVMSSAGDYYTHGEIGFNRQVVGTINKDLKYAATVLALDGSEVGTTKDPVAGDPPPP